MLYYSSVVMGQSLMKNMQGKNEIRRDALVCFVNACRQVDYYLQVAFFCILWSKVFIRTIPYKEGLPELLVFEESVTAWHKLSIGILQVVVLVHVVQSSHAVEKGMPQDQTNKLPSSIFSQGVSFSSVWATFAPFITKIFSSCYIVSSRTDSWIINFIIWFVKFMPTNPKGQLSKKLIWSPAMAVLYLVNDQLQSDYSLHHSLL